MQNFEGKTAVITGGASGIGLAMAERFAAARMNVVLADIEENALKNAADAFAERQQPVLAHVTDTMRRDSIDSLFEAATQRFGNIHVLCNNAGVVSGGERVPVWEIADSDWEWVMGVNFYGVLYGLRAFVPHMLAHGESGHIVNTASVAAFMPGGDTYGVSKHGVLCISEALHRDLADTPINASVLCPGWTNTKIAQAERNRPRAMNNPHNPEGKPLDVANALENGRAPSEIADAVFEAIQHEQFYILPHQGWDAVALGRAQAMVDRGDPYELDIVALRAATQRGDDL